MGMSSVINGSLALINMRMGMQRKSTTPVRGVQFSSAYQKSTHSLTKTSKCCLQPYILSFVFRSLSLSPPVSRSQNDVLRSEIVQLRSRLRQQERMLTGAVKRLRSTNQLKEGMERIIIEQRKTFHKTHADSCVPSVPDRFLTTSVCLRSVTDSRRFKESTRKPRGELVIQHNVTHDFFFFFSFYFSFRNKPVQRGVSAPWGYSLFSDK